MARSTHAAAQKNQHENIKSIRQWCFFIWESPRFDGPTRAYQNVSRGSKILSMGTMTNNKKLQRPFVWLAIFAVLVASLAPPISRVVFRQTIPMPEWIEVCTVEGLQYLPVALIEDEQSPDSQPPKKPGSHSGGHAKHCSFCVTHACSLGLAPVEASLLPFMAAQGHHLPSHAPSAPQARFGWEPNLARAPPVFL
jgi:hypothetical protein